MPSELPKKQALALLLILSLALAGCASGRHVLKKFEYDASEDGEVEMAFWNQSR